MIDKSFNLILILQVLLIMSCNNPLHDKEVNGTSDTVAVNKTDFLKPLADPCSSCDSLYNVFPFTDSAFFDVYGWTEEDKGSRYGHEDSDIDKLANCLEFCYSEDALKKVIVLQTELEFEADGPALLQYKLMDFYMKNPDRLVSAIDELSKSKLEKFIRFNFAGIKTSDSFHPELCTFLSSLAVKRADYSRIVLDQCSI